MEEVAALKIRFTRSVRLITKALKTAHTKAGDISNLSLAYNLLNFNEFYV